VEEGPLHLRLVTDAGVFTVIPPATLYSFALMSPGVRTIKPGQPPGLALCDAAAPSVFSHFLGEGCPPVGGASKVVAVTDVDVVDGGVVVVELDGDEVDVLPRFVVDLV
jgi:hypothetical protein